MEKIGLNEEGTVIKVNGITFIGVGNLSRQGELPNGAKDNLPR